MKNYKTITQWVVGATLWFIALLSASIQLHAQSDTVTIYGSKFAPNVKVYINNVLLAQDVVTRVSSTQLRVIVPNQFLNGATLSTALRLNKSGGGNVITNAGSVLTFQVENPGIVTRGKSNTGTVQVKPDAPRVHLTARNAKSDELFRNGLFLGIQADKNDTIVPLTLWYNNVTSDGVDKDIEILITGNDAGSFALLSNAGDIPLNEITVSKKNGNIPVKLKMMRGSADAGALLSAEIKFRVNGEELDYKPLTLYGSVVERVITIAAYYTPEVAKGYYREDLESSTVDSLRYTPEKYLQLCVEALNKKLHELQAMGDMSKFARTRFALKNNTASLLTAQILKEKGADPYLQTDLDQIMMSIAGGSSTMPVLVLINSETTPYRGIISNCNTTILPNYIIVEVKYARRFIDPSLPVYIEPLFYSQLQNIINNGQ